MLHLFSASQDLFAYAARHYRPRSPDTSTLLMQLLDRYQTEDLIMPDALDEFTRQTIDELLKKFPAKKRIEGVPVEELAAALSPEDREALARLLKVNGTEAPPK